MRNAIIAPGRHGAPGGKSVVADESGIHGNGPPCIKLECGNRVAGSEGVET